MEWSSILEFLLRGLDTSAPIAFAALGGVFTEKAGVFNIALEGIMILTSFAIVWGSIAFGGIGIGLLFAVCVGAAAAFVHGVVTIVFKVNQIVSGTALNIFALGTSRFLSQMFFGQETQSLTNPHAFATWHGINTFGLWLLPATALVWFVLNRTVFGLRLRSVGENPEAADTLGIDVTAMRFAGVVLSGVMCGLSAAVLYPRQWVSGMTGGRGFIAIAAMVFGRWDPVGAVLGSMLFGFSDTIRFVFGTKIPVPAQFVQMLPYVLAIVVLAGFVGRARAPAAGGKPYEKE